MKQRAQGKPGARCTRGLVCKIVQKTAHEHTGSAETLRPSPRNGFTAYAALSPATNSSCHRRRRIDGFAGPVGPAKTSANLTPATGARTTWFCRTLQRRSSACRRSLTEIRPAITFHTRRCRVHRIPCPTFVTIAKRPSQWVGMVMDILLIWVSEKPNIFAKGAGQVESR
jgi:hypothetical protein